MKTIAPLLACLYAIAAHGAEPQLHLDIRGSGSPAVVLESGFGGTSESWSKVQPEVAKFTRVISYDRAGLGTSKPGTLPRTATRIAQELHAALRAAGIKPPYVLVGHSAGGAFVRVFAHLYPKEVAGLLLIDPPQEELLDWLKVHFPEQAGMPANRVAQLPPGMRSEWDARDTQIEEMRAAWPLPKVPTVLLTSARNDRSMSNAISAEALEVLLQARKDFLRRLPSSKQVVAEKSGHNIPNDEPELVIAAIRQIAGK